MRISLNPMPGGSHWPHGIISGWSWFSAKHATVLMRRQSYDANWGYYTQDASKLVDGKTKQLGVINGSKKLFLLNVLALVLAVGFFAKLLKSCYGFLRLEDEELWAKLREWDDVGYSMSCPSRGDYKGIMAGLEKLPVAFVRSRMIQVQWKLTQWLKNN